MKEKEIVKGVVEVSSNSERNCKGCGLGKQTRDLFSKNKCREFSEIALCPKSFPVYSFICENQLSSVITNIVSLNMQF